MTTVLDVRIVDGSDTPPFFDDLEALPPAVIDADLNRAVIMEMLTDQHKAGVVLLGKTPDGQLIRVCVTANIIDMLAGVVRGACMRWGQWK